MIDEYIRYRISLERADAFVSAYEVAAVHLRASEHCLGYHLSRCIEDPQAFILHLRWDSADGHLVGFRKGPEFPGFLKAIQPFVGDIEEMRHYAPTELHWVRPDSP